jgi:hypothetical protein
LTVSGGLARWGVGGILLGGLDAVGFAGCKRGYQAAVGDATKRLQKAYHDNRSLSHEERAKADHEAESRYRDDLADAYMAFLRNKAETGASTTNSEDSDTGFSGCQSAYSALYASATKWLTDEYRKARATAEEEGNTLAAQRKRQAANQKAEQEYRRHLSDAQKAYAQNIRAFGR